MKNRICSIALVAATLTATLLTASPASASAAVLPECANLASLDCEIVGRNLEVPANEGDAYYCQHIGSLHQTQCERYWPFINPTIHPELAPPGAFTAEPIPPCVDHAGELAATQAQIRSLQVKVDRQASRIKRLKHRLHRVYSLA